MKKLVETILSAHSVRRRHKVDETLSINVFNPASQKEKSTTGLNGDFVHSQLLTDCLLSMTPRVTDKNELIRLSKQFYEGNTGELSVIHEFEKDYAPDRALWWYTRESFLYRLLNKALRIRDIDLLYLFRFFIHDIHEQLRQQQCSSLIRVFRGQLMSNDELQTLKGSTEQFISMNSFLSTSLDRRLALSFLSSSTLTGDAQRVLFEIDLDPTLPGVKPFADISSGSFFTQEKEVLIMLGSVFQLAQIDEEDRVWVVRMALCSENDNRLKPIYDYMKNEYDETDGTSSLLSFGTLLFKMGQYDKAENYCRRLLAELPRDHPALAACYHNLGTISNHKADHGASLTWFTKSLDAAHRTLKADDPTIASTYNSMGEVHLRQGNRAGALESFNKALAIRKKVYGEDDVKVAACYHNIGNVYQEERKFSEAIECHQKALIIRQKHLPADHPDLGATYHCVAGIYLCLNYPDLALQYYNMALKIYQNSLPNEHPDIAMTHYNLGLLYNGQNDFPPALTHFLKAAAIFRATLSPTHPFIARVEQDIRQISDRLT